MRVFLGLAALAATAQGQTVVPSSSVGSLAPQNLGNTATARIDLAANNGIAFTLSPTGLINSGQQILETKNFQLTIPSTINTLIYTYNTNSLTSQLTYRWRPNFTQVTGFTDGTFLCDPCTNNGNTTPNQTICNALLGPGQGGYNTQGFPCASLTRTYTHSGLVTGSNYFSTQVFNVPQNGGLADTSSYSFIITKSLPAVIVGDPQIVGMQGQDFQVHGVPDEIFNIVSYPTLQINARFTYLESGACHDNFTACFAHPGTYISEEGIRIGKDKIRVSAGSFKKGLTVHVNGKKVKTNVDLKNGAVELVSHRRVVVHTDIMRVAISNSDMFLNQELELMDDKLVSLGAKRVSLKDNERFHSEVPLHGLQGQTWKNVEYPSGLEYEGSIMDYHVVDGNLFGTDFVFNQFQS